MKYLILVITFGILISGCSNNTNTSEKHNLKGKVKKLTEFTYYSETEFGDVVKGSVKEKKESNFSEEYNLDGKLKERITYTTSKNPDHKYYYFYSEDDQLIKIEHRDGLDDDLFTTSNYTYDGDLLIQIIEEYPKEEGGELKVKTTYEYNQKGKIIHIHSYNHYYEELVFDRTYNYNENSKLISIEIKGDEDIGEVEYYDVFERLAKKENIFEREVYHYNDDMLLVKKEIIDRDGSKEIIRYEYQFDENGNWVTKHESGDDRGYITERTIEYF